MPSVSVCAPYWNRQAALTAMCAQYAQLYPEAEVSICDDGSTPPAEVPPSVTLTRLPEKGGPLNPCVPTNRAVEASSGEIVVLTNPEIEHREPVLGEMLELLEHEDDYVLARCWDVDRAIWLADDSVDYSQGGRAPVPPGGHFHFCAMLHRSLWVKAGGFDETYRHVQGHDDNDWLWRLHAVGVRFRLAAAVVYHRHTRVRWGLPSGRALLREKWGV